MIAAWYYLFFIAIIIGDQLSKWWVTTTLAPSWDLNSFLSFELMINKGISWSMFDGDVTPWFVYCAIGLVMGILLYHIVTQYQMNKLVLAEVAVFAGAVSNSIDRFIHGGVIDFITFHYNNWYFPSFNVADIAITLGVMCMIIQLIQER
jgi:signal peptidase II